ncbi:ATP-grasp domain-containing protein [bacterium]|nr:ATP-grasp domain-containing protein [bacterium]
MKKHILHIGYHPAFHGSIDFENNNVSVITHQFLADLMSPASRREFSSVQILDVPHNMNLDEYNSAFAQIRSLANKAAEQVAPIDAVVGLYEHVTLPAARLREELGIQGKTSSRSARLCRDKVLMKQELEKHGVKVPRYIDVEESSESILKFLNSLESKVVLKPKSQAASEGVKIFENKSEAIAYLENNSKPLGFEFEEFIEGQILHFDGVIRNGELRFFSASKYLDSCFGFVYGDSALCSVTLDSKELIESAKSYTLRVLNALSLSDSVFHLEAFLNEKQEFTFLEIGNRFGGAGVAPLLNKAFGVDIVKEAILAESGEESAVKIPSDIGESDLAAAWLYTPLPTKKPAVLRGYVGTDKIPSSVFFSEIPNISQRFNDYAMAFPASGKFFLKGSTSEMVQLDCLKIIKNYKIILQEEEK